MCPQSGPSWPGQAAETVNLRRGPGRKDDQGKWIPPLRKLILEVLGVRWGAKGVEAEGNRWEEEGS